MSQETEEIKSRLNIVDVVGDYVRLNKAGSNWKGLCPFHNEKSPSFMVSEEKQICHCFGCGKGGDIFTFFMEIEGVEFREALKNLAERAGVQLSSYSKGDFKKNEKQDRTLEILELATRFYEKQLWEGAGKEKKLNYLYNRGLKDGVIKDFRLGYAPDGWRNMLDFLLKKNYKIDEIIKTGLVVEKKGGFNDNFENSNNINASNFYDRFRERIMFPVTNTMGRVVGYSARVSPGGDESQAKYVNTPETEIYKKGKLLYGIDKAKINMKQQDEVLIVEGNMDVIASHQAGIGNVVAVSGTALTVDQLNILKRYTRNLKLFFDMDDAGQLAARKSSDLALKNDFSVFVVEVSGGKDAADLVKDNPDNFVEEIKEAKVVAEYFIDKAINQYDKNNPEGKKKILEDIARLIASFSNDVDRDFWTRELSQKIDVREKVVMDSVRKIIFDEEKYKRRYQQIEETYKAREKLVFQDRVKNIQIEMMGLLVSDEDLWRTVADRYEKEIRKGFTNQEITNVILDLAKEVNFDFERLLEKLPENKRDFLREIYFENVSKQDEEVVLEERVVVFENYFLELQKEKKKKIVQDLIEDIKKAESMDDKQKVLELTEELSRVA